MRDKLSKFVLSLFHRKESKRSMNIKVENTIPNIKVSVNQNADGSFSVALTKIDIEQAKRLGEITPGNVVKIGGREYIVLEQLENSTAVITKESAREMVFGKDGNYINSDIRKYCTGEFYKELADAVGEDNITTHAVNLMADDGTGKEVFCQDKVSILTSDLYRKYRDFLPAFGRHWWTATRVSASLKDYARLVCFVFSNGALYWNDCVNRNGVRPFCVLDSSISVN